MSYSELKRKSLRKRYSKVALYDFLSKKENKTLPWGSLTGIRPTKLARELKGDFAVVVDPPRKGLDKKVVDTLLESEPKQIVYLSCGPATLARDLSYLKDKYNIEFIQPYDMFPQTANVETLVSLKLK